MSNVTVEQLADVVGAPVERLLEQLKEAGIKADDATTLISDEDKLKLLDFLRSSHGKNEASKSEGKQQITLKRKSVSELKLGGAGRSKTVNVEVRKKRTYVKRSEAASSEKDELDRLMAEKAERDEGRKQAEEDARRKAEEAVVAKAEAEAKAKAEAEAAAKEKAEAEAKAEAEKAALLTTEEASKASKAKEGHKKSKKSHDDKDKAETRYGRKELHVASGKSGQRKKKPRKRSGATAESTGKHGFEMPVVPIVHDIGVPETIKVSELAQKMSMKSAEVIKLMMKMGVMATINQVIDQDTAILVIEECGHKAHPVSDDDRENTLLELAKQELGELVARPPVVTIMGHVDHGKTSLLDYIRASKVASGEAGGITQHIGAYHVETDKGVITFLDTPGHAAFTSMRARGAQSTDIVILVVAADDGVMPQTVEAIQHSKAAGVPIIVAVNKIDKEDADPDRVKTALGNHEVIPEEWGGENIFINVSAKTGEGIDDLLDAISLQAEVMELQASATGPAKGLVVEASLDKGRGVMTTILVQQGQLNKGDILLAGQEYGRVRAMFDENGNQISEAGPSIPVLVLGLPSTPSAGDPIQVLADERTARELAMSRSEKDRNARLATQQQAKLESMFANMGKAEVNILNILLKADVQGSLEAIREALVKLAADNDEVDVNIIGSGVGGITETDITLAAASNAIVLGFNVRADAAARKAVSERGVDLHYYSVIYDLIDEVKRALTGMLAPEYKEQIIGLAEVKDAFKSPKFGLVAGSIVTEGVVKRNQPIRVLRENVVIYEGELESLRRFKDDVDEVRSGTECGIAVKNYNDVKPGDQIEVFERVQVERTL
ncbi:MAG: translation initiation factor IF-2 [Gammaproteobacteria bacterium]|nr:translation initiation factor IF-2 [Gammaproteobacteria bacterium]MCW8909118.1 translation initiation factor IF-2 [Gammaproteobacteria bacterium]MCW9005908.1 translation initiation factor IF-2 [Gammaproteobacteria bacterium]MCW9056566.1 translation initiation factor IF-2 [Gammaproteobacteria bacterium]